MINKIRNWRGHSFLALPVRLYLGYVFIAACIHKIASPADFAIDIATYQILPIILINPMAIALPWIELVSGAMIILAFRTRTAALMMAGMMFMFTVAVILALAQGLDMSCGCFASQGAVDEDPISWLTVLRDVVWMALALYVLACDRCPLGVDRLLSRQKRAPN
ncbi:MAG: DoxX family membrane protein [Myxococcales bacterium]|jgi:uncharacterized membrane protein YphA (DoxX/SURF4 family)|nr:DoxX family membrane protein [Myxococcales bacterium]